MLGGGGGGGPKLNVGSDPDTGCLILLLGLMTHVKILGIWLNFTTYGGLRRHGGRGQLMFGGLRTKPDRPRYLRCIERPGVVGMAGHLSGVPAGRSGTRNGRMGGFRGSPTISIARAVPHGREPSIRPA